MSNEYDIDAERDRLRTKLDTLRPDRYKSGQIEWADSVVKDLAELDAKSPARQKEANRQRAEAQVRSWDEAATRSANAFFREVQSAGQLPLGFALHANLPISIDKEKFRLGTVTEDLIGQWELNERRAAARDADARNRACEGARLLGVWLKVSGSTFAKLDPAICVGDDDGDEDEQSA